MSSDSLPIIARAMRHAGRIALRDGATLHRYADLLETSGIIASSLLGENPSLHGERVAFQIPAGFHHVAMQWAIWRAGGVAVPVSGSATRNERDYVLEDTGASWFVTDAETPPPALPAGTRWTSFSRLVHADPRPLPEVPAKEPAMILYTSGTTSRPKGVVTTHGALAAQISALCEAWEWRPDDRIPLFLPLHHVHGIINVQSCALWSGACVETSPHFEADAVLARLADGAFTVFMAVPTIYAKLAERLERGTDPRAVEGFRHLRLMVSGSAALPPSLHERWLRLTGQVLLERYGMTETGMILSNPYHGERRCGTVGQPLPGVEVRLRNEHGEDVTGTGEPGEIQVRGPALFSGYWNQPEATGKAFVDGWFRTGDLGILEDGYYRILGRLSVDIIKCGGYKLSALEIEAVYLDHPSVSECAVVGLPDDVWGEIVAMAIVPTGEKMPELDDLREWGATRLSAYKLPRKLRHLDALPRNAMGKVAKRELANIFR